MSGDVIGVSASFTGVVWYSMRLGYGWSQFRGSYDH